MRHRIIIPTLALLFVGCAETSNTTSTETCANVALSPMRIADAATATAGTPQVFTQALAIYRYTVTPGARLTATLDVPADKDYQMAFFDTSGNRLSCSDSAGLGVDEAMQVDVGDRTQVLVKVWTDTSPSNSAFTLLVTSAVSVAVTEQEPNDTPATAQPITAAFSTVTGAVDSEASDADDYFAYSVAPGDVVTVETSLTSAPTSLVYVALRDEAGDPISVGGEDLFFSFDENMTSATLTYTVPVGMDTLLVWMSGIPGAAPYRIVTSID